MISSIAPIQVSVVSNNNNKNNIYKKTEYNQSAQIGANSPAKTPSFQGDFVARFSGFIGKAFSGIGAAVSSLCSIVRYVVPEHTIYPGKFAEVPFYDSAINLVSQHSLSFLQGGLGLLLMGVFASIFHTRNTRGMID